MTIAWLWAGAGGVVTSFGQFPGAAAGFEERILVSRSLKQINPQKIRQQIPVFYFENLTLLLKLEIELEIPYSH